MTDTLLTVVLDDARESIRRVAASLLSGKLHSLYIDPARCGTVHAYGKQLGQTLAESMTKGENDSALTLQEETELRHLRGSYAFRAAHDPRVSLHMSEALSGWTIICEEEPLFARSCAPRQLFVKPVPESWEDALLYVRPQLHELLLWPPHEKTARKMESLVALVDVRPLGEGIP